MSSWNDLIFHDISTTEGYKKPFTPWCKEHNWTVPCQDCCVLCKKLSRTITVGKGVACVYPGASILLKSTVTFTRGSGESLYSLLQDTVLYIHCHQRLISLWPTNIQPNPTRPNTKPNPTRPFLNPAQVTKTHPPNKSVWHICIVLLAVQ